MLTPEQRVRFARHRSLVEVGDEGQRALLAASIGPHLADPSAEAVRADYLTRAGLASEVLAPDDSMHGATPSVDATFVEAFAGAPYLHEAAASCLGSLHAVERIKAVLGLGRPLASRSLPPELTLVESD